MEATPNSPAFSVDFLLNQVAASIATAPQSITEQRARFEHMAIVTEANVQASGDTGATLVREVERYLESAADEIALVAGMVQQLGDLCLDHTMEHELAEEETAGAQSQADHNHGAGGHSHDDHVAHPGRTSSKKRKSKRRHNSQSLLDLYFLRLKQ